MSSRRIPRISHHKASGQAVVRLNGKDHYLGKHGSPEAQARYDQLIAEWLANAKTLPSTAAPRGAGVSVAELLVSYWQWAEGYYRDEDGTPSGEIENIKLALRPVKRLYAHTPAIEFGPLALRTVQQEMVKSGLSRSVVNARVNRIRRVFTWAVSLELLPATITPALATVPGLRRGRGQAKESPPVEPVAVEYVEASIPHMTAPVRAMVQLQLLTACRAGEVMAMRAMGLNMSGPVWTYTPKKHKNEHRGLTRVIFLGPKAQEVLKPFLTTDLNAYLFSPKRFMAELRASQAALRTTKPTASELRRKAKARRRKPKCQPGERYTRRSYRLAVHRACELADVPAWSPLQLRHTAANLIRAKYGLEAAKAVLGHQRVETSQIYAEKDMAAAARVISEIG